MEPFQASAPAVVISGGPDVPPPATRWQSPVIVSISAGYFIAVACFCAYWTIRFVFPGDSRGALVNVATALVVASVALVAGAFLAVPIAVPISLVLCIPSVRRSSWKGILIVAVLAIGWAVQMAFAAGKIEWGSFS